MQLKASITLATYLLFSLYALASCKPQRLTELKPVLIKSVVTVPKPKVPIPRRDEGEISSRKIYHIPARRPKPYHENYDQRQPDYEDEEEPYVMEQPSQVPPEKEKAQILHRPKGSQRNRHYSSASNAVNEGPVILGGKNQKVKYASFGGNGAKPQGINRPPQVYVISSGNNDEEEDQGMMGSMQTYFKSMTGKIRNAFQRLTGGITD